MIFYKQSFNPSERLWKGQQLSSLPITCFYSISGWILGVHCGLHYISHIRLWWPTLGKRIKHLTGVSNIWSKNQSLVLSINHLLSFQIQWKMLCRMFNNAWAVTQAHLVCICLYITTDIANTSQALASSSSKSYIEQIHWHTINRYSFESSESALGWGSSTNFTFDIQGSS